MFSKALLVYYFNLILLNKASSIEEYSDEWLVKIDESCEEANKIITRNGFKLLNKIDVNLYILRHLSSPRSSRTRSDDVKKSLLSEKTVLFANQQKWNKRVLRSITVNDPQWTNMWYLNGKVSPDMGVQESWDQGYSGKNVIIAIVDDGIEIDHPDLMQNYRADLSFDAYDRDNVPSPSVGFNHGTQCAGIPLAVRNTECVIGVAFDGKLAGIRIIGALGSTDTGEHDALLRNGVDIFSNSWGTEDKLHFEGPSPLVESAIKQGTQKGRGGLGSIYVWAAGNGGSDDNCNCDGFVNSIYTIAISSVSSSLQPPGYAEPCAAIMAAAYSGGGGSSNNICTTNENKTCTTSFTGTSAATPMAAGIFALVLQANPKLSWRDLQHLIVNTSDLTGLKYGKIVNRAGRPVSDYFGFGLLKANLLVERAKTWVHVKAQHRCQTGKQVENKQIYMRDPNRKVSSVIKTDGCNNTDDEVEQLEHVQATIKYSYSLRGACQFYLISPSGTKSQLLTRRGLDLQSNGQQEWTFMSVQFWDEVSYGDWTLEMSLSMDYAEIGELSEWSLTLYGTTTRVTNTEKGLGILFILLILFAVVVLLTVLIVIIAVICRKKCCKNNAVKDTDNNGQQTENSNSEPNLEATAQATVASGTAFGLSIVIDVICRKKCCKENGDIWCRESSLRCDKNKNQKYTDNDEPKEVVKTLEPDKELTAGPDQNKTEIDAPDLQHVNDVRENEDQL